MSSSVSRAGAAATSATRVDILSALSALLCAELTEARRAGGRRSGSTTQADIGKGGLVATVRTRLSRSVHRDGEMRLSHLLWELEVVGCSIRHLALHLEVAEMLLRLNHAHVDILLVCGSDLLLLLL